MIFCELFKEMYLKKFIQPYFKAQLANLYNSVLFYLY